MMLLLPDENVLPEDLLDDELTQAIHAKAQDQFQIEEEKAFSDQAFTEISNESICVSDITQNTVIKVDAV